MTLEFTLNDEPQKVEISQSRPLSSWLREHAGLHSLHEGCQRGMCGQCMVLVNNVACPSCLVFLHHLGGARIETIEGMVGHRDFLDIERAFLKVGLNPCPHCAGVKAVMAEALLRQNRDLRRQDVLQHLPESWCQCSPRELFVAAVIEANISRRQRSFNVQRT